MGDSINTNQLRLKRLEARRRRSARRDEGHILNQLTNIPVALNRHGNNRHWLARYKVQKRQIERYKLNKQTRDIDD